MGYHFGIEEEAPSIPQPVCKVHVWHIYVACEAGEHHNSSSTEVGRAAGVGCVCGTSEDTVAGACDVARTEWSRVPRKLLSSWVYQARPIGRPCIRWADSIEYDMNLAGVKLGTWQDVAMDREKWGKKSDKEY